MTNPYALTGVVSIIFQALLCIAYLAGIVAGIITLIRKQTRNGILVIAGFLLFGLALLANIILSLVVLPALMRSGMNYGTYSWLNVCIPGPLTLFGVISLVVMAFTNIGKKAEKVAPEIEELPPAP